MPDFFLDDFDEAFQDKAMADIKTDDSPAVGSPALEKVSSFFFWF